MPESCDVSALSLPPDSELARLMQRCPDIQALRFRDGDYFIREGEADREAFLVLDGAFVVEKASGQGGRPAILACVSVEASSPVFVGEMAGLGIGVRSASVRSSGSTHALGLASAHFDLLLEGFPGLTRTLCRQFARRLKETSEALRALQGRFALEAKPRMLGAGECLFRAGEEAGELFQLLGGELELEGGSGELNRVGPEQLPEGFVDPLPFLSGRPQRLTARAPQQAFLYAVPAIRREALLRCHPELVLRLLAELSPA